jgi:hypothetical protein
MGELLFCVLGMFTLGATTSWRFGLVLAFLSALGGSTALIVFHVGIGGLLLTQLGLFVAACGLWLLASLLAPRRGPVPAQLSATHRDSAADSSDGAGFGRGLLAVVVFVAVVAAPFVIAAVVVGPVDVDWGTSGMLLIVTGGLGIAVLLVMILPLLIPALRVASWASGRILKDSDQR